MRIILVVLMLLLTGIPWLAPPRGTRAEERTRPPQSAVTGAVPTTANAAQFQAALPKPPDVMTFIPLQGEALERALKAVEAKRDASLAHPVARAEPPSSRVPPKPPVPPLYARPSRPGPSPAPGTWPAPTGPAWPVVPATGR